jgi:serine/threonine-protein kinase
LIPLAREAVRKALELDPTLPEANTIMGVIEAVYDYNWKEAERRFRLALARDPVSPLVLRGNALYYLLPTGQLPEAVEAYEQALQQDPLNVQFRFGRAVCLTLSGNFGDAEAECSQMLEIDPSFFLGHLLVSLLSVLMERKEGSTEAFEHAERAFALAPWFGACVGGIAGMLMRNGNAGQADELMQKLRNNDGEQASLGFILFNLLSGEADRAVEWLERLIEQRHSQVGLWMRLAKVWYPSPRWAAAAKKMHLPDDLS